MNYLYIKVKLYKTITCCRRQVVLSVLASLLFSLFSSVSYAKVSENLEFVKKYNKYHWQQIYYGEIMGKSQLMFSHSMTSSKLYFADLDSDGDQDAMMGLQNGRLAYWENQGSKINPKFKLITDSYKGYFFEIGKDGEKHRYRKIIQLPGNAAPALIDIDGDKDFDLLIGNKKGTLWFFENRGNNLVPLFYLVDKKFMGITVGQDSVPTVSDLNLNGKTDLVIGNAKGEIWFYKNKGTVIFPRFTQENRQLVGTTALNTKAVPQTIDWNEDGFMDIVVGAQDGTLIYYENKADVDNFSWKEGRTNFNFLDVGGDAAPAFSDLNGNNRLNLVVASTQPTVELYEIRQKAKESIFWNIHDNFFSFYKLILRGNKAIPAFGDLDGDGDIDVIIGEENGNLNYYENKAEKKNEINWFLQAENLIRIKHGFNSAPALGDIDDDGDLDLLIGKADGSIYFVENIGTPKQAKWKLKDTNYFQIDVGNNAVPRLHDIDQDGDLDLLIGGFNGNVVLYKNTGTKKKPFFVLTNTRFVRLSKQTDVVPSFFDWNNDGREDIILGSNKNNLQIFFGNKKFNAMSNWKSDELYDIYINSGSLSAPLFYDLDQDGLKDLIIGNGNGDILFFKNLGTGDTNRERYLINNSVDSEDGSLVVYQKNSLLKISKPTKKTKPKARLGTIFGKVKTTYHLGYEELKKSPIYESKGKQLIPHTNLLNAAPTLADIDDDQDLDMLIGTRDGKLLYYRNDGSDTVANFKQATSLIHNFPKGNNNIVPVFSDIDKDGDYDLIIGSQRGTLVVYRNEGSKNTPLFVKQRTWFKNIWLDKNAHPAVWDFNDDGYPDLLVGSIWGRMAILLNRVGHFELIQKDFQGLDIGHNASPFLGIPDNRGNPYLLVGNDQGKILFFQNKSKNILKDKWEPSQFGTNIKLRSSVKPVLADIDADGDQDLLVGTEKDGVLLFKNKAQKAKTQEEIKQIIQKEAAQE